MPSEIGESQKDKCCMIDSSYMRHLEWPNRKQNGGCQEPRGDGNGDLLVVA